MATKAPLTAEQYLHGTFECDAGFVDGEIVQRAMPDGHHSTIQFRILMAIGSLVRLFPLFPYPELRLRLEPAVFRDGGHRDLVRKLEAYRVCGLPNIELVDPHGKQLSVYTAAGLQSVSSLARAWYALELTPATLFSDL